MLKVVIEHNRDGILDMVLGVHKSSIISANLYSGYNEWFNAKFVPSFKIGASSIISVHDKKHGTLLGFSLVKHSDEFKISNLSPLVDGVGMSQCLLDGVEFFMDKDYDIYIPEQAEALISRVKALGFHYVGSDLSKDLTKQHRFTKPRNISWI